MFHWSVVVLQELRCIHRCCARPIFLCRGVARHRKEDAAMGVSTMKMSDDEVQSFAHYVCNLDEGKKSGITKIGSINETGNSTTPVGDYPEQWVARRWQ